MERENMTNEFVDEDESEDILTIMMPFLGLNKNYVRLPAERRHQILPISYPYSSQPDMVKSVLREIIDRVDDDMNLNVSVDELSSVIMTSCEPHGETENVEDDQIDYTFTFKFISNDRNRRERTFEWEFTFEQVIDDDEFKEFLVYFNDSKYVCCIRMITFI